MLRALGHRAVPTGLVLVLADKDRWAEAGKTQMLKHQDIGSKGTISPLGDEFFMRFVSGVWALLEYRGVILNLFPQMRPTAPSLSIFEKPVKMQNSEGHSVQGIPPSPVVCAHAIVRLCTWHR